MGKLINLRQSPSNEVPQLTNVQQALTVGVPSGISLVGKGTYRSG
ncbi:hypothetical protein [Aquimarina longa]|nr:hypothetical protein [Aquimarina longa]